MAIIGSIQSKGRYFLIGFVGLALLTFILSDLTKCSGPTSGNQGTISGDPIDSDKYYQNIISFTQNDSARIAQQEQRMMTEKEMEQSRDRAWSATVDETLLNKEFEALGIDVSDKEFHAYLYGENGFTLMQDIAQSFTDQMTGLFNPKELDRFIQSKETSKNAAEKKQWEDTKKALKLQRKQEKYFQLLSQGVYVTKLEAKTDYRAQREIKSVSFVLLNYRDIPDEDVKITEKEIKAFYEEHKKEKKYEVLAGRDVKYFDVTIQPSHADSTTFSADLTRMKAEFAATKDDSAYVIKNTESQMRFPKTAVPYRAQGDPNAKGQTYPAFMDTVFKTAGVGTVVGPYSDQGKTYLAKVLGVDNQELSARHILLPAQKADAANSASQKRVADSLTAILKADKTRFDEFVKTYSTDGGSKDKGGKYDFTENEFVQEFSDYVLANPVGAIGVVQSDFGFHIIEVLGKKPAHIPLLAVIEKTLVPSIETQDNLKDKAYELLYQIDSKISQKEDPVAKLVLFDTIARREGFFARPVRMIDEAPRAQGFTTRQAEMKIIQMAFDEDAEVGQLCSAPISDEGRYIIAIVSSIRKEKGEPAYADVYERMRVEAIKDKKAQKFIGQIGKSRDLNAIAKKANTTVQNADITFANPSIQGGGYEPEIVGSLFSGVKDGASTLPLVGNAGVYVFKVIKTTKAPAAANYDTERKQMASQAKGSQQQEVMQALRKKAQVYDNRILTELGIFR